MLLFNTRTLNSPTKDSSSHCPEARFRIGRSFINATLRVDMVCLRRKRQVLTSSRRHHHVIPFSVEAKTRALPASLENTKIKRPLQHRRFHVYRPKPLKVASMLLQMCSPRVTPFVPGQSVTVGKRHYSHAYLL